MRLVWRSRQGQQRNSNNDALTVGKKDNLLFCMLVDAAEKTSNSQRFAMYWGKQIVTRLIAHSTIDDSALIVSLLEQEQQRLRNDFLPELASYSLLCLETDTGCARTFHVGDCLAGVVDTRSAAWWFNPHTLDQGPGTGSAHARHLLTRSLNARRFSPPDMTSRQITPGTTLIVATDGYWAECLQESHHYGTTLDDASYLTIETGPWRLDNISDTDNCCVITDLIALGS